MASVITDLISLIATAIGREDDVSKKICDKSQLEAIYALSKKHDVAHLVAEALKGFDFGALGDEGTAIRAKLEKQKLLAFFRYEKIKFALAQLCELFEAEGVDFMPLKGSVIRKYYPEEWMRTSCDIDILVREEQLEHAAELVECRLGFKRGALGSHDIGFDSASGVHFELHYALIEETDVGDADRPLLNVWQYASIVEGKSYEYAMSDEMFYYYHVAHMAKHFVGGGCGIRPFIDLWILNSRIAFDGERRRELLTTGGLSAFATHTERLSEVWFGDGEHSEVTLTMQEYLLGGGVYGNITNRVAVGQTKKGGKLKYALSRIWLPYEVLRFHYPSLNGRKWLLPFYEVRRWFKLLFFGGVKRARAELGANKKLSGAEQDTAAKMLSDLGL